jgi:competence protein ComFC
MSTWRYLVRVLKYRGYLVVAPQLAAPLMLGTVREAGRFDAVASVPLHCSRLARRGFNQAAVLGREVAGRLEAGFAETLRMVRATRDQVELSATERRANVRGAFRPEGRVRGRVLLVDDVLTTEAALSEGGQSVERCRSSGSARSVSLPGLLRYAKGKADRLGGNSGPWCS